MKNDTPVEEEKDEYYARFNLFTQMAYFVAKTLHIRPNDILDTWAIPELIVAYGQYANEISTRNYEEWAALDQQTRNKIPHPDKYFVKFYGVTDGESGD